jgi:putative endonuclease
VVSTSEGIENRLRKHNSNHKGFTGKIGDQTIKHVEEFSSKSEEVKREKLIKSSLKAGRAELGK